MLSQRSPFSRSFFFPVHTSLNFFLVRSTPYFTLFRIVNIQIKRKEDFQESLIDIRILCFVSNVIDLMQYLLVREPQNYKIIKTKLRLEH